MFPEAAAFNGDLSAWEVSKVTNMAGMFYEAPALRQKPGIPPPSPGARNHTSKQRMVSFAACVTRPILASEPYRDWGTKLTK